MSAFPYTTTSPPPTAGPLPVIERANASAAPYGGGGGGGVSPAGISTAQVIGPDNSLDLLANLNTSIVMDGVASTVTIQAGGSGQVIVNGTFLVPLPSVAEIQGNLVVSSINGAAPSGGGVNPAGISTNQVAAASLSTLTLSGTDNTRIVIDDTKSVIEFTPGSGTGKLDLNAYSTIVRYDLNVSSINGAAPGSGSVPADLALSTLTFGIPGGITAVSSLQGVGSVLPVIGGLSVSSLSVSSINGASPGGGSSAFFSTLYSGSSTINCDAAVTTALLNFGTTIGHVYQIQTQMKIQGNGGQEGTLDDDVAQEVVNQLFLNTTQGSFISTANAAARDVNIGTCGMWKATQGIQALAISGSFSTQVVMTGVSLLDYGAI